MRVVAVGPGIASRLLPNFQHHFPPSVSPLPPPARQEFHSHSSLVSGTGMRCPAELSQQPMRGECEVTVGPGLETPPGPEPPAPATLATDVQYWAHNTTLHNTNAQT